MTITDKSRKRIQSYFDKVAITYQKGATASAGQTIADLADVHAQHLTLDIGSGTGRVYRVLISRNALAIAVDMSLNMLIELRKMTRGAQCILADSLALPFADSCFDRVVSNELWICMLTDNDQVDSLREMARVLRPDGIVLVGGVRNASSLRCAMPSIVYECLKRIISACRREERPEKVLTESRQFLLRHNADTGFITGGRTMTYNFAPNEILQLFEDAGLRIFKIVGRKEAARVPIIWRFTSDILSCFLLDIAAKKTNACGIDKRSTICDEIKHVKS
jgi:ubiquinone/menaquinone biosynthesis C-methylase UbiE